MEYNIETTDRAMNVTMQGQFTFTDNKRFRHIITKARKETLPITLNLSQLSFIDSAALGMLLLLRDECQQRHIPISIHEAQGQVEKIFYITKFDQLFIMEPKPNL